MKLTILQSNNLIYTDVTFGEVCYVIILQTVVLN